MKRFAAIFAACSLAAHLFHLGLKRTELPQPPDLHETLPSAEALRLMSLGFRELVADYYWLNTLSQFGDKKMYKAGDPNVRPLLLRTIALDPYFAGAYEFAGAVLELRTSDVEGTLQLLEQGMRYRPDVWRIPFLLGFNAFFYAHDYARAAEALTAAAKKFGAPPATADLAAAVAAEAGRPEVGIMLIDSILPDVEDERTTQSYLERRRQLQLEVELRYLGLAADRFKELKGRRPQTIEELVSAGLLPGVPADPLGGQYYIDSKGLVATTSEEQRLRLSPAVKGWHK